MDTLKNHQYEYAIADGQARIFRYTGSENFVRIPETLGDCPVTVIGERAFADNLAEIEKVEIPGSVREIGEEAFANCFFLSELILHSGLEVLRKGCLRLTGMQELYFPPTLREIEEPEEIGGLLWQVDPENPLYTTDGYGLYFKAPEGLTLLAVQQSDEREEYRLMEGTEIIGFRALANQKNLRRVMMPDSLRIVGEEAFSGCSGLEEVRFNEGLKELGPEAFKICVNLKELTLPASLEKICKGALDTFRWDGEALFFRRDDGKVELVKFYSDELQYRVPEGVHIIGPEAFLRSLLRVLTLPESLERILPEGLIDCRELSRLVILSEKSEIYLPPIAFRTGEILALAEGPAPGETRVFNYEGYDDLFITFPYAEYRMKMAVCRLKFPAGLTPEWKAKYESFLQKNFRILMEDICEREDLASLGNFGELGLLTQANVEEAMDIFSEKNRPGLVAILMDYRRNAFGNEPLDLEL